MVLFAGPPRFCSGPKMLGVALDGLTVPKKVCGTLDPRDPEWENREAEFLSRLPLAKIPVS